MLNYIKKLEDNRLYISKNHTVKIIDTTFQKYVNHILAKTLSTIETSEKLLKRKLNLKAKVPIYIDKETILMCIKSYRLSYTFYINYKAIYDYHYRNGYVYIFFINHHSMRIKEIFTFKNQLLKCQKIIQYLNK